MHSIIEIWQISLELQSTWSSGAASAICSKAAGKLYSPSGRTIEPDAATTPQALIHNPARKNLFQSNLDSKRQLLSSETAQRLAGSDGFTARALILNHGRYFRNVQSRCNQR